MPTGESTQTQVHYQGKDEDFIVFIDDADEYKKWKDGDTSIPLAHFVSAFKVFITHKQGAQGNLDGASKSTLAAEFDTEDTDEVIKQILEKGTAQKSKLPGRGGDRNDTMGGRIAH